MAGRSAWSCSIGLTFLKFLKKEKGKFEFEFKNFPLNIQIPGFGFGDYKKLINYICHKGNHGSTSDWRTPLPDD
jgi:hypothetical protein